MKKKSHMEVVQLLEGDAEATTEHPTMNSGYALNNLEKTLQIVRDRDRKSYLFSFCLSMIPYLLG